MINFIWLTQFLNHNNYYLFGLEEILVNRSFLFNWIFYFSLGFVLAHYYKEIISLSRKYHLFISILFIAVLISTYFEINTEYVLESSRPANLIYIPIIILYLLGIYEKVKTKTYLLDINKYNR